MAQEPDLVTQDATDAPPEAALIERDIERTRAEMSETIDAIGARFEPAYLREQAKDAVRETAREAGTSMIDTLRDNPLPAAIAGLSIAWLFANRSSGARRDAGRPGATYGSGYGSAYGGAEARYARPVGYAGSGYAESDEPSLKDRASDALDAARERAEGVGQSVSESAHHLQERAGDLGGRTMTWLEDQMDRNPLGVGAVVLAAGAVVGLSVPSTDAEDRLLGDTSARLGHTLKETVGEKLEQAKSVASEVIGEAKQKAGELAESAKEKAGEATGAEGDGGAPQGQPQGHTPA